MMTPMMTRLILSVGCLTAAQAEQPIGKWDAGVRLNTMGIQGEVGYLFNKTFAVRLQSGGYNHYKKVLEFEKVKYHHVRFRPIVTLLYADWYFLKDWWRVSVGIGYNHTKIHIKRDLSNAMDESSYLGILSATYRYKRKISPYLGTGVEFRNLFGSKFIFSMDAGINYMGEVKVSTSSTGPGAQSPQLMAKARKSSQKLLNDKWWIKYYPAISVGVKYEL